jgi:hypothetical protein
VESHSNARPHLARPRSFSTTTSPPAAVAHQPKSRLSCPSACPSHPHPKPRRPSSPPSPNAAYASSRTTSSARSIPRARSPFLTDGTELPYELFLGIPIHRVPQVVVESGLAADPYNWVPVNKQTLETKFPRVYAVGDVNGIGTPKAGVFAEGAARVVAAAIIAQLRGQPAPDPYRGIGICYLEFGNNEVGRVEVEFLVGPKPTGTYEAPSEALRAEKDSFGSSRVQRWFGSRPTAP